MACADIRHEVRQSSPARACFGVLLLLAISGLLTACGGDVTPAGSGGGGSIGGGGGAVVCTYSGGTATVLNWNAVPNVNGYRVYYGTGNSQYFQQFGQGVNVGAATTYQVPNLSSGTTYYFAVTSFDAVAESVFSNEVCKIIL